MAAVSACPVDVAGPQPSAQQQRTAKHLQRQVAMAGPPSPVPACTPAGATRHAHRVRSPHVSPIGQIPEFQFQFFRYRLLWVLPARWIKIRYIPASGVGVIFGYCGCAKNPMQTMKNGQAPHPDLFLKGPGDHP